jgi:branched-chain amino acid transport system substrate-binding protein
MQAIRHWMAATLGALAVLAAPAAIAQAPAATVKVGLIGPFTGPSSDFGIPLRQGIELAVAEINNAGGYLGRPLELVVRDDKGNPDAGLARPRRTWPSKVWWRPSAFATPAWRPSRWRCTRTRNCR